MTEEEAKSKWCPHARVASSPVTLRYPDGHIHSVMSPPVSVNRGGAGAADEVRCLGSGCMAWRWLSVTNLDRERIRQATGLEVMDRVRGYCGLAGEP